MNTSLDSGSRPSRRLLVMLALAGSLAVLAAIGGGLLGAMAGDAVEHNMGKSAGLEITVRLDNGETRVIAQEADVPLSAGQRVRVISGGGPTRVVPM